MTEIEWHLDPRSDDFYRGEHATVGGYHLTVSRIPPACEEETVENVVWQVERLGALYDLGSRTSFEDAKAAAIAAYRRIEAAAKRDGRCRLCPRPLATWNRASRRVRTARRPLPHFA
jgi:hypothetical protein